MSLFTILEEVAGERERQNDKWGVQNHNFVEWIAILTEEVGEASKEAVDLHFHNYSKIEKGRGLDVAKLRVKLLRNYRTELIQVAAVAVQMVECFDRQHDNLD